MSAREPLAVPAQQALTGAGMRLERAMDSPAPTARRQANCGACGQAWFGDVAYCPYCGRPSAGAPTAARAEAPGQTDPPRMRWKAWGKPVAAVAAVLIVVVAIAANKSAVTRDRAAPQGAGDVPAPTTAAVIAPSVQAEPPTAPAPPAPPPRNRTLCSAASEAAGLCNPN